MTKRPRKPAHPSKAAWLELRDEAAGCQRCDLWRNATQTVFGEGSPRAKIMLVEADLDPSKIYVTNVVKHFKWEPRGKRRIHKRPSHTETVASASGWMPRSPT